MLPSHSCGKWAPFLSLHSCEQRVAGVHLTEVTGTVRAPADGFLGNRTSLSAALSTGGGQESVTISQPETQPLGLSLLRLLNANILPQKEL